MSTDQPCQVKATHGFSNLRYVTSVHCLVPTEAPSNPNAVALDSTSARINWGPVPQEHHHGIIRGYRIFYRKDGNDTELVKESAEAANSTLLLSLAKAAKYRVKLLAFTSAGEGKASELEFLTHDDSK